MDRVTKPTHYELPRVRTYPQGTRAGCLSTIVPRRYVYYPCTFSPAFKVTSYECSGRSGLPDHPLGSNPQLEDFRWVLCHCTISLYLRSGGEGGNSRLFLFPQSLTSVLKSDPNPSVGGGACIASLLVLMDRWYLWIAPK